MGFNVEAVGQREAREEARARWICTPGWHVVRIVDWRHDPPGTRRFVTFELRDDAGRAQTVRFRRSRSMRTLHNSELLRFVVAAMNWRMVEHEGDAFAVDNAAMFRELVGRRVAVYVAKDERGFYTVVNWAAAPQAEKA
jgi:hypothetical protein